MPLRVPRRYRRILPDVEVSSLRKRNKHIHVRHVHVSQQCQQDADTDLDVDKWIENRRRELDGRKAVDRVIVIRDAKNEAKYAVSPQPLAYEDDSVKRVAVIELRNQKDSARRVLHAVLVLRNEVYFSNVSTGARRVIHDFRQVFFENAFSRLKVGSGSVRVDADYLIN